MCIANGGFNSERVMVADKSAWQKMAVERAAVESENRSEMDDIGLPPLMSQPVCDA